MRDINVPFNALGRCLRRKQAWLIACMAVVSSACSGGSGGGSSTLPPMHIPMDQVHEVCWKPSELGANEDTIDTTDTGLVGEYYVLVDGDGAAISSKNRHAFAREIKAGGFIYQYVESAPIHKLRLIPLTRTDAWCNRIPRPTDPEVLRWLTPSTEPTAMVQRPFIAKNFFAQAQSLPIRSGLFCGKQPRMAPTTTDTISLFRRNIAYQESYEYAHKTAMALTQAEADIQAVVNNERGWLKRAFTSDPGTLEQIQLRVAAQLNSIEAPPEYDDPELECIAALGFESGFHNGKFEVEAKLFAIDVGVMLVEFVAMEVALGPLGGAKFLASAASRGTKAMTAAMSRLKNIPIFIPGAAGGVGGVLRVGNVLKSLSRYHSRRLEAAMFEEARLAGKTLVKLATDETHHIVAHGADKAKKARAILAKFDIDIDHAANGVFLPAAKKSPNPKGSIVHKILGNNDKYYKTVEKFLEKSTSQADALQRLRKIGEALEKGTIFNAPL